MSTTAASSRISSYQAPLRIIPSVQPDHHEGDVSQYAWRPTLPTMPPTTRREANAASILRATLKPADYRNDKDLERCFNDLVEAIENADSGAQLQPLRNLMLTFLREPSENLDGDKWENRRFRARLSHVQRKACDVIAQRTDIGSSDRRQLLEEFFSNFAIFLRRSPTARKDAQRASLKMAMRAIKQLNGWDRVATAGALYRKVFVMDAVPHRFKQNKNFNLALKFARRELEYLNDQYPDLVEIPQTIPECQALLESLTLLDNGCRDTGSSPVAKYIQDQGGEVENGKAWQETSPHLQKALANARSLLIKNSKRAAVQAAEGAKSHAIQAQQFGNAAVEAYWQLLTEDEWQPALTQIERSSNDAFASAAWTYAVAGLAERCPVVESIASRDLQPLQRINAAKSDAAAFSDLAAAAKDNALMALQHGLNHVRARLPQQVPTRAEQLPSIIVPSATPEDQTGARDERAITAERIVADTLAPASTAAPRRRRVRWLVEE